MWFDGERQPNTLYVASVSRGKDSTAMLRAIQLMGWPLDMIASVDIWATDDIPAELPPMVAFKDEWDAKCLEQFGVPVTRLCATRKVSDSQNVKVERERATSGTSTERTPTETLVSRIRGKTEFTDSPSAQELGATDISKSPLYQKLTYEKLFYHVPKRRSNVVHVERERAGKPTGFPQIKGNWCTWLKTGPVEKLNQGIPCSVQSEMVSGSQARRAQTNMPMGKDGRLGTAYGANRGSREKSSTEPFQRSPKNEGRK